MIKSLYLPFQKWSAKGSVYIYSDPHFGDWESYTFRGLSTNKTKEELDLFQVNNINKKVTKQDTIIFLGDIGEPELLKKVRGYKVLIMGNHDKGASIYKEFFDEIYEGPLMISDRIILSHEPIIPLPPYLFNIHGHDHSGTDFRTYVLKYFDPDINSCDMIKVAIEGLKMTTCRHFNTCAEWIGYIPVNLKDIINSGLLSSVPSIHRNYIDNHLRDK